MLLLPWTLFLPLLAHHVVFAATPAKRYYDSHHYYVLEHDPSSGVALSDVAHTLGVEVVEQAGELINHWLVRVEKSDSDLSPRGEVLDRVLDTYNLLRRDLRRSNPVASSVRYLARQTLRQRVKRAPPPIPAPTDFSSKAVADRLNIQDPLFTKQWHLVNDEQPEHSMNATSVWEEMGLTGKGIISSLVDDGLDYTSEDLKDNFVRFRFARYASATISYFGRTQMIRTISMITNRCRRPNSPTTITVPVVQAKLPQARITRAVSDLPTNLKSRASVSSPGLYRTSMRQHP